MYRLIIQNQKNGKWKSYSKEEITDEEAENFLFPALNIYGKQKWEFRGGLKQFQNKTENK